MRSSSQLSKWGTPRQVEEMVAEEVLTAKVGVRTSASVAIEK
jgi:hypothetical protein